MGRNTWFRFYNRVLNDHKVQSLPAHLFKAWVNCMCIASENEALRGSLPNIEAVAYALRVTILKADATVSALVAARLFEWRNGICYAHDWEEWQFQSDVSTDRVKRFRERLRNVSETEDETKSGNAPDTDTDTDIDQIQKTPISPKLIFGEFKHVQLTHEEHAKLKARLNGNLESYIDRLDRWGEEQPQKFRKRKSHYATLLNWFDRDVTDGKVRTYPAAQQHDIGAINAEGRRVYGAKWKDVTA